MTELLSIILSLVFSVVNPSPTVVTAASDGILSMPSPKIIGKVIDMPEVKIRDKGIEMPEPEISTDSSEKYSEKPSEKSLEKDNDPNLGVSV